MRHTLNPYYLQQMGIVSWVQRNSQVPALSIMIVLESGEMDEANQCLAGKAGHLLKKMMHSIGISWDSLTVVMPKGPAFLKEQIAYFRPRLILALGECASSTLKGEHTIPVIISSHPEDLLRDPSQKKQVFAHLMQVKKLLG